MEHEQIDILKTTAAAAPANGADFAIWLQGEFGRRCRKNPRYSLRAFAKFLEMDASTVSQIMAKKRNPSLKMMARIAAILGAAPDLHAKFKMARQSRLQTPNFKYVQMQADVFNVISDWHHIAILEITQTRDFKADPARIARQLGITVTECRSAIERLKRVGLLEDKKGSFVKRDVNLSNYTQGLTSPAHRALQSQVISKALAAIEDCRADEKDITSIFMSIDEAKLPEARLRIEAFRKEMCGFLEGGPQTRVYNLAVQLFPISKNLSEAEGKAK